MSSASCLWSIPEILFVVVTPSSGVSRVPPVAAVPLAVTSTVLLVALMLLLVALRSLLPELAWIREAAISGPVSSEAGARSALREVCEPLAIATDTASRMARRLKAAMVVLCVTGAET
eukprot:CAMPEP_0197919068 /NCGR_PEP_ID=MMETSP1439-20131203/86586_1 /TAXON_ID=66791 /ORGANISM="Gonyaulax spinifera, Strain CCMP409" /LENGTH=117 /DNA_ID=CAMNT_0043541227 /DNA_START=289 /DNA_END=642 /DNA_ORIENTATION=+